MSITVLIPLLILSLVSFIAGGVAQNEANKENIDLEILKQIHDEGFNRSKILPNARYLCDVIGPRLTGSPSMKKAIDWISGKMQEYGLDSVHLEPWKFGRSWEEVSYSGRIVEPFIKPLIGRSLSWTDSTDGLQSGHVIIIDRGSIHRFDPAQIKVLGKWILIDRADDIRGPELESEAMRYEEAEFKAAGQLYRTIVTEEEKQRDKVIIDNYYQKLNEIKKQGALGFLIRSTQRDGLLRWSHPMDRITGNRIKPEDPTVLASIVLTDEDYSMIYRNVVNKIPVKLEFDINNRFIETNTEAYNTIGEVPGSDLKDEIVLIGAHLDSIHLGSGAIDNAAGVVVMLEAMRILKVIGANPRRTIRIALWSGEEQLVNTNLYLLGSNAYIKAHNDELEKTSVYLNLDGGSGRIRGVISGMNSYVVPIYEQIIKPLEDLGVTAIRHSFFVGSDHLAFDEAGIPALGFIQDPVGYWKAVHSQIDTYDALMIDDMKQAAVVVAFFAYSMSMRDGMLPRRFSTDSLKKIINANGIQTALEKYDIWREYQPPGYTYDISEGELDLLGHSYLTKDDVNAAKEIFILNERLHPEGYNTFISSAKAYLKIKNNQKAIEKLKQSLRLNPKAQEAIKILNELGVESEGLPEGGLKLSAEVLDSYVGKYEYEEFLEPKKVIEIKRIGDKLILLPPIESPKGIELVAYSENRFSHPPGFDRDYTFTQDESGKINAMVIRWRKYRSNAKQLWKRIY
jgi:hypothetical protein